MNSKADSNGSSTMSRRTRGFRLLLIASIISLAIAACGGGGGTEQQGAATDGETTSAETEATEAAETEGDSEMTSLTVGITGLATNAPLYLAQEQGWFEEVGLDVSIEIVGGGAAVIPALSSGEMQIGSGNLISTMQATQQGISIRSVSAINVSPESVEGGIQPPTSAVLVPGDSEMETAADLEGKTVAINTLNNLGDLTIRATVQNDGGDPSAVEFTELPFPDMIPALEAGRVDAIWEVEPFVSAGTSQGLKPIAYNFVETMPRLPLGTYFTTEEYASENGDILERFDEVVDRGTEYALENEDEVRRIVTTYTEIPEEAAQNMALPVFTTTMEQEKVQRLGELVVEFGLIEELPNLDDIFGAVYEE